MIDHLLRLPLVISTVARDQLGTRVARWEDPEFLTGQALTTILDAAFSVIYIAVMLLWLFSP